MMKTLGICSVTNALSLAVVDQNKILGEVYFNQSHVLSEKIVSYLDHLFSSIDDSISSLSGISVTTGPGAFTPIRVGITTAKIIAQFLEIPIVGLDSLDCIAHNTLINGTLLVAQKACRNEINVAIYGKNYQKLTPAFTITLEKLAEKLAITEGPLYLSGDAATMLHDHIPTPRPTTLLPAHTWEPRAAVVAMLGQTRLDAGEQDKLLTLHPTYSHAPNVIKANYGKNYNIL